MLRYNSDGVCITALVTVRACSAGVKVADHSDTYTFSWLLLQGHRGPEGEKPPRRHR